ncbi:MAG TPA: ROK family transcriptional regulator [Micromonosporaceae bacterium]|nr:ROK family transcriptional regulator [Micromonosporaceae bacterium]
MSGLAGSSKLLRAINSSAALALLLDRGTLTRGDLRELTGLSKPTTSEVLRRLTEAGLAVVVGRTSGGPGPNAEIYAPNPAAGYAVAISVRDTTETKRPALVAAVCDLIGTVLARTETEIDLAKTDPGAALATAVADVCDRAGVPSRAVGHIQLGVPGAYDPATDTIHHIDVPGWNHPGLVGTLAERLDARIAVDNDVNLAAIAERGRGVAGDVDSFAVLWLGDEGLGLAIDLGGTVLRGARGGAGEIGYLPVGLGARTDLQGILGGPAVRALASAHGFPAATPESAVAGAAAAAGRSRKAAAAFLTELAERIALALSAVAAVLDPPLVVLAGEVAQAGGTALRDAVAAALAATQFATPVEVTALTDDAVLLGALDAGLRTVREALIGSLRNNTA